VSRFFCVFCFFNRKDFFALMSVSLSPFERASKYVRLMPDALSGSGGHNATFAVARVAAHGFGLSETEVFSILVEYNARCVPPWTDSELRHKAKQACRVPDAKGRPVGYLLDAHEQRDPRAPAFVPEPEWTERKRESKHRWNRDATMRLVRKDLPIDAREWVEWLRVRSPLCPVENGSPGRFLESLYLPGEVVIAFSVFESQGQFAYWVGKGWYRLGERRHDAATPSPPPDGGESGIWYLAQPVQGKFLPNPRRTLPDGRVPWGRRHAECVTSWRWMVLENDYDPREPEKAPTTPVFLNVLAGMGLPIAAIYSTGGRGVHALVKVDFDSKARWDSARSYLLGPLAALGCDPGALTGVRLSRLPGCWRRERENVQRLLYLDPNAGMDGDHSPLCTRRRVRA
jgi:hypothetical protein